MKIGIDLQLAGLEYLIIQTIPAFPTSNSFLPIIYQHLILQIIIITIKKQKTINPHVKQKRKRKRLRPIKSFSPKIHKINNFFLKLNQWHQSLIPIIRFEIACLDSLFLKLEKWKLWNRKKEEEEKIYTTRTLQRCRRCRPCEERYPKQRPVWVWIGCRTKTSIFSPVCASALPPARLPPAPPQPLLRLLPFLFLSHSNANTSEVMLWGLSCVFGPNSGPKRNIYSHVAFKKL